MSNPESAPALRRYAHTSGFLPGVGSQRVSGLGDLRQRAGVHLQDAEPPAVSQPPTLRAQNAGNPISPPGRMSEGFPEGI